MRLWHKQLISVLPRQQLVAQWRECSSIVGNILTKGTPNHILVNKIMDYPIDHFITYAALVRGEMTNRGYHPDPVWSNIAYRGKILGYDKDFVKDIINQDIKNNQDYKENKLNRSCKKISFFLKNRMKGIKLKKEGCFNITNKILINANINEVNKSYK